MGRGALPVQEARFVMITRNFSSGDAVEVRPWPPPALIAGIAMDSRALLCINRATERRESEAVRRGAAIEHRSYESP